MVRKSTKKFGFKLETWAVVILSALLVMGYLFLVDAVCELEEFAGSYYQNIPFLISLFFSFFFLISFLQKGELTKALLAFLLPLLLYSLYNYTMGSIAYGRLLLERGGKASADAFTLMNVNFTLCSFRVIFTAIGVILWCIAWEHVRKAK